MGNILEGHIKGQDFLNTIKKFDKKESFRGILYWLILDKLRKYGDEREKPSYKMSDDEAILYVAFLCQWNRANHQITELEYDGFKEYMSANNKKFNSWKTKRFETWKFGSEKEDIINLFRNLQVIKGIEWVGASKILHMRLPKLFVPIDTAIAKDKTYKIKKDAQGYFEFLDKIKDKFGKEPLSIYNSRPDEVKGVHKDKTFTKAVDEYNYCKVHPEGF